MGKRKWLGKFYVQDRISTTCRPEIQKLAFDKAISWSHALEVGIKKLAYGDDILHDIEEKGVTAVPTKKNNLEQIKRSLMQLQMQVLELDSGFKEDVVSK